MGPLENRRNPLESELNNPEIEKVCRDFANLRYSLLSYNYTLAWEAREKGLPMMRAMWLHYPEDLTASALGDQYLWGRDMLVAPVYRKGITERQLYLPDGHWHDWWTGKVTEGGRIVNREVKLDMIPLYIRAGAIIPVDPPRQFTTEEVGEPLEIRVYTGADGSYVLYEDDGISQDYLNGDGISTTAFSWDDKDRILQIKNPGNKGSSREFIVNLLPEGEIRSVKYNGKRLTARF
jgi:alpha-glucosidase/alpha-D-xyloside xylohydrolase